MLIENIYHKQQAKNEKIRSSLKINKYYVSKMDYAQCDCDDML